MPTRRGQDVPTPTPSIARRFESTITDDAVRFGDDIRLSPGLTKDDGEAMSAYSASFRTGAVADLPAPYAEVWVILTGALRIGAGDDAVTASAGDFVHIPEHAPGTVEALEDTTMVCISTPAH
jgi:quercetin dioxygenase-like cupin family protein